LTATPLDRLRAIALALPEAEERETWDHPTFRVRSKIFAIFSNDGPEGAVVSLKAPPGVQALLLGADPQRFFPPPYTAHKGWVGVRLGDDAIDWAEVAALVARSWRMTAPRRLAAALPEH
jgi:hypothetical protein